MALLAAGGAAPGVGVGQRLMHTYKRLRHTYDSKYSSTRVSCIDMTIRHNRAYYFYTIKFSYNGTY